MNAKHQSEIRELRAQLEQQQAKTGDAKEKLMREKTKRRQAQVERETWREKYIKQQALAESAPKNVKQEEGSEDWKAMLFEQERKTEHYKLKYIALKEEKKVWQAQVTEQAEESTEREARDVSIPSSNIQENNKTDNGKVKGKERKAFWEEMKPKNCGQLRQGLHKYWQREPVSEEAKLYFKGKHEGLRREILLGRLSFEYVNRMCLERSAGVDIDREDVRIRIYMEAIRQMKVLMESHENGIKNKGQARNLAQT